MLKTVKIEGTSEAFILSSDGINIVSIKKDNLSLNGKNIFDNFVSKLDLSSKLEISYDIDLNIVEPNEKRVVKDLREIFDSIAKKINEKFKLQTEEIDDFLTDGSVTIE